jgi:glycosyltransferase involved in cell wall biosynthesis
MTNVPDVSVIVPVYNKAKFLSQCLDSILSQDIDLEIICIDDASTDHSGDLLTKKAAEDSRIRPLFNTKNIGAGSSRNIGFNLARGSYVQFTDADDWLPPSSLTSLVSGARRNGADVVRAGLQSEKEGCVAIWENQCPKQERSGTLLDIPEVWVPWFHTCYLFSRQLLIRHGIAYPVLRAGEDPVFLARVLTRAECISTLSRVTYTYRMTQRVQPDTPTVLDYFRHAELVKAEYCGRYEPCWSVYRNMIKDDIAGLVSCSLMAQEERTVMLERVASL